MAEGKKQIHFVLVHGGCHGAWSWYKVASRLRSQGHLVTALDMAAAGVNPKHLQHLNSFSNYYHPLMKFLEALPPDGKVVLVGHSMGGICISAAMEKFPEKIAVAVFVTAFMPSPEFNVQTILKEALTLATMLVRPAKLFHEADWLGEAPLSKQNYCSVPRVYIIADKDNLLKPEFQTWMIENNPTSEVQTISGADHMVMFSRPQELCFCLQDFAEKYCRL
ncbi:hypothetical protein RD792_008577 [Penstemon davidsonii]|uniref:AB hydrolase-1 domain-containing protein n=1 Tax=Penstemon davidsonii TaxID=160366 RepID=A0ABR0D9I7_9LAMI|nr:hypothetical protein RD792_008577 [Penstemon davidsonii]